MRLACIDDMIILFPVSTTGEYYMRLRQGQNGILFGTKGTGKSFSFFIYSYLSAFKVQYFLETEANKNELLRLGRSDDWFLVPQICYINLKD